MLLRKKSLFPVSLRSSSLLKKRICSLREGKPPVPGRPANLVTVGQGPAVLAVGWCGWGLFGHFLSRLSFLFSFSLSLGDGPI